MFASVGLERTSGIPIIINCRDRLGSLIQLVDYLERADQDRIYLVDNDSTYPPLLEYLDRSPHEVVKLGRNAGRLSLWEANLFDELGIKGRFVFTDPDIVPDEGCPLDAIEYFGEILDMFPDRDKAGFGLQDRRPPRQVQVQAAGCVLGVAVLGAAARASAVRRLDRHDLRPVPRTGAAPRRPGNEDGFPLRRPPHPVVPRRPLAPRGRGVLPRSF